MRAGLNSLVGRKSGGGAFKGMTARMRAGVGCQWGTKEEHQTPGGKLGRLPGREDTEASQARRWKDFPGRPVAKACTPQSGSLGSISGRGTRFHIPQLKIPHATTTTWCSQIKNKIKKFLKRKEMDGNSAERKWRVHGQSQVVRGYILFTYSADIY